MRSLSPGPSLYSADTGTFGAAPLSATGGSAAKVGAARAAASAAASASRRDGVMAFIGSSVLIGGAQPASPVHDRMREGLAFERLGVDRVRRIARGADGDAQRCRELVV